LVKVQAIASPNCSGGRVNDVATTPTGSGVADPLLPLVQLIVER